MNIDAINLFLNLSSSYILSSSWNLKETKHELCCTEKKKVIPLQSNTQEKWSQSSDGQIVRKVELYFAKVQYSYEVLQRWSDTIWLELLLVVRSIQQGLKWKKKYLLWDNLDVFCYKSLYYTIYYVFSFLGLYTKHKPYK